MVKLEAVRASNSSLVQRQPLVAVFFGGTGGIGSYTIRELASAEAKNGGKGLRAYVIGRNAKSAEEIIADCRRICPKGEFRFIKAGDLSLIKEVDRLCEEVKKAEEEYGSDGRIDYLMVSQGGIPYLPRKGSVTDSSEGIDVTMSLMYYSRMRIITKLLPLLLKSQLPATVVSVYAAGAEDKLYQDDLSLRNLKIYTYNYARSHMCYMHTLFFEALSQQYPGKLSLIHIFPGLVPGPGFHNPELPLWFRILFHYIMLPLFGRWITMKPEESGQRMLNLATGQHPPGQASVSPAKTSTSTSDALVTGTDGKPGSGVYSLTWSGESNYPVKKYETLDKEELRKKVWEHTTKAFSVIEKGGVFTE
ncbi:hypothetical protein H2200_011792 [Cladophialophora chaetospira]|uniref:NAD(P)-binding protein n=1 Tax=Cladophialophora chaetospira TaxID=386627 RepID=A0AA39CCV7_9EURO|nr:hypothetical protein H2200_011792 [Cladophialophora chaetospira]